MLDPKPSDLTMIRSNKAIYLLVGFICNSISVIKIKLVLCSNKKSERVIVVKISEELW